jgi:hypothetical protein
MWPRRRADRAEPSQPRTSHWAVFRVASSSTATFAVDADDLQRESRRASVNRYASLRHKLPVLRSQAVCARVRRPFLSRARGTGGKGRAGRPGVADGANPPRDPPVLDMRQDQRWHLLFQANPSAFSCLSVGQAASRADPSWLAHPSTNAGFLAFTSRACRPRWVCRKNAPLPRERLMVPGGRRGRDGGLRRCALRERDEARIILNSAVWAFSAG